MKVTSYNKSDWLIIYVTWCVQRSHVIRSQAQRSLVPVAVVAMHAPNRVWRAVSAGVLLAGPVLIPTAASASTGRVLQLLGRVFLVVSPSTVRLVFQMLAKFAQLQNGFDSDWRGGLWQ